MVTIQKLVKKYLKENSWPTEGGVNVGPGTCDGECTEHHAYAVTIKFGVWTYSKPCYTKGNSK